MLCRMLELISIKIRFLEFFEVALEFNWPKTMGYRSSRQLMMTLCERNPVSVYIW